MYGTSSQKMSKVSRITLYVIDKCGETRLGEMMHMNRPIHQRLPCANQRPHSSQFANPLHQHNEFIISPQNKQPTTSLNPFKSQRKSTMKIITTLIALPLAAAQGTNKTLAPTPPVGRPTPFPTDVTPEPTYIFPTPVSVPTSKKPVYKPDYPDMSYGYENIIEHYGHDDSSSGGSSGKSGKGSSGKSGKGSSGKSGKGSSGKSGKGSSGKSGKGSSSSDGYGYGGYSGGSSGGSSGKSGKGSSGKSGKGSSGKSGKGSSGKSGKGSSGKSGKGSSGGHDYDSRDHGYGYHSEPYRALRTRQE
jgi:hypothetical protein